MDLEANSPLPDKKYDRITRNLRHTYFSVYRRLNFLVILPNIVAMIILGAQHGLLNLPPQLLSTAVATNLTVFDPNPSRACHKSTLHHLWQMPTMVPTPHTPARSQDLPPRRSTQWSRDCCNNLVRHL